MRFVVVGMVFWLGLASCSLAQSGVWLNRPTQSQLARTKGLLHESYDSSAMQTEVGYSVVLPPDYEKSSKRYPVVYWLHGGGGNEISSLFTAACWSRLSRVAAIADVILVYPNGRRSGYMDHHDGKVMAETMIIRELVSRIDRRFRTIASREGRAVHGFSMGASGALKFAIKHPELFCAAVAYGGGAIDLENSNSGFIRGILQRNLDSKPELIRQNNTYHYLKKNGESLRQLKTCFLLICGEEDSWLDSAVTFRAALRKERLRCELLTIPDVGHNMRDLSEQAGVSAALFQDCVFEQAQRPAGASSDSPQTLTASYFSAAEGRRQKYQVVLPPGYSEAEDYPLFVQVFGGANMLPTAARPFVRLRPNARGVWGYRSISRYDVLQVIADAKRRYSVDEDRVYITGTSAGATGVMHVAAQRPDIFAAVVPLVAFGNDLPLENFRNLPLRCEHGTDDWTSAIGNVRVQFQRLRKLGYDAVLNEYPKAGHGIRIPLEPTMQWLFQQRRQTSPSQIVYSCENPADGRAYWLRIRAFNDPHRISRITATVDDDHLTVTTENVRTFSLDFTNAALQSVRRVKVDGAEFELKESPANRVRTLIQEDGWRWRSVRNDPRPQRRDYRAGAAANLFQGEPLLVVYGTGGAAEENAFLKQAAEVLCRSGGPTFKAANVRFPVRADHDLGGLQLSNYNLLLLGTPENNSYLAQVAGRFPYQIQRRQLRVSSRTPLPLDGVVAGFHYFNPLHPRRLLYVVSPYLNSRQKEEFLSNPRRFLAGSAGFKMIDQPDLIVRRADLRICLEMQLGADWSFAPDNSAQQPIPESYDDRSQLALAHLKVMQRKADVDLALWWGPADKGLFGGYDFNWLPTFDPAYYTLADYLVRRRETETMLAELSGQELADIHARWIATEELLTWPPLDKSAIDLDRTYRIAIPMDLVPKLGIRRRTLEAVRTGPIIKPEEVAAEVFSRR